MSRIRSRELAGAISENKKKAKSCRFITEECKFILYIMRSRCLRDIKQLFNHVDIWSQAENRPLLYKAQHRERRLFDGAEELKCTFQSQGS